MGTGRRRGRGKVLRPRDRAPDTPQNRARQREEDATITLLRQQQEIMAQMVDFFLERQPVPNMRSITSGRTDTTSATTKDGCVCRHRRDGRGVQPILGATSRSLVG
ncbi:hypothetical protein GEV33_004592 [Tenebrio molitor]|uniref:Uncharacterized protein n=1 Tax=Tenebrio molitor TaxID=7067 RepID=A0A8J6LDA3_TENMO|nr:hypothetical protein GEV33_004592 [Tenebrio molitor]